MGSWEKPLNSRRSVSSSFLVFPFRGLTRGLLSRGVQQLPFPQYPSVAYQPPFASCGIPGCRREAITYRTRPALFDSGWFTEVFKEQRSPRSRASSCQSRRRVSFSDTEQEERLELLPPREEAAPLPTVTDVSTRPASGSTQYLVSLFYFYFSYYSILYVVLYYKLNNLGGGVVLCLPWCAWALNVLARLF